MPRRILEGEVISDRAEKTVTVLLERKFMHPGYKKYVRRTASSAARDASAGWLSPMVSPAFTSPARSA